MTFKESYKALPRNQWKFQMGRGNIWRPILENPVGWRVTGQNPSCRGGGMDIFRNYIIKDGMV